MPPKIESLQGRLDRGLAAAACFAALITSCLFASPERACADDVEPRPETAASDSLLANRFEDARISIRVPRDLQRAHPPVPKKLNVPGVHGYVWYPIDGRPGPKNLVVALTPFAKPSTDALDKTDDSMKQTIQQRQSDAKFGETQNGHINGTEVRSGSFTATMKGEKAIVYYLVGIDSLGTYGVTATLPMATATQDERAAMMASIFSFRRPSTVPTR
jgi:hypothetical protein